MTAPIAIRMDWLTGIAYSDTTTSQDLLKIGYPEHDKVGNRTQRVEDGTATAYSYDDLYRVTNAQTGIYGENFTYDNVGNRESGPTVKDTADVSYDHNAANQMTKGRKFSYQYDNRGNQIYRIMNTAATKYWHYSWNATNQLIQADLVMEGDTIRTVLFQYDAFGRRTIKQTTQSGSTISTNYIYDGEDIILQIDSDGTTTTATHYVQGPGIDEPLAMVQDSNTYYYHADGLGSIIALTDSNKAIVQRYGYDTYGMLTSIQNPEFSNSYTYTAREWDKELGLYYYRARYYDPMEGRFISKDPIAIGGNIYTVGVDVSFFQYVGAVSNPYLYTDNNPVNWADPLGLCRQKGESSAACASRVAFEVLGDKLELMDSFGYIGAGALAVSFGTSGLSKVLDTMASDSIKGSSLAGAETAGDIVKKKASANKAVKTAVRTSTLKTGLAAVSKATGILGAAATGSSLSMRGLGYYFGECYKECDGCE